jgi:hypothetical protein
MSLKPLESPPPIKEGDDRINEPPDYEPVVNESELEDTVDLDEDDHDDS